MLGTILDQFNTKYDEVINKVKKSNERKSIAQMPLSYSYQSFQTYVQTSNKDGTKTIEKESVVTENGETTKTKKTYVALPDGQIVDISNLKKPKYKLKKLTY